MMKKQIKSWQKIQFKSTEKAFDAMLTYWLEKGAGSTWMASKSTNLYVDPIKNK